MFVLASVLLLGMSQDGSARPLDADDLVRLARVSDPVMSLDGRLVAGTLRETDMGGNRGVNGLWIVPADHRSMYYTRLQRTAPWGPGLNAAPPQTERGAAPPLHQGSVSRPLRSRTRQRRAGAAPGYRASFPYSWIGMGWEFKSRMVSVAAPRMRSQSYRVWQRALVRRVPVRGSRRQTISSQ